MERKDAFWPKTLFLFASAFGDVGGVKGLRESQNRPDLSSLLKIHLIRHYPGLHLPNLSLLLKIRLNHQYLWLPLLPLLMEIRQIQGYVANKMS